MATSVLEIQASSEPSVFDQDTSSTETLFDDPDADIILRSRDDLDCRVQKVFLVKSSPLLNGLIQAASDHSDAAPFGSREALPVVRLSERGAILHNLLTFVLPVTPVLPPTLKKMMELLSVAQRYEMSHAIVHIRGSIALKDPPLVNKDNALRVYSLAQKCGLRREVVQAARITLKSNLTIENVQDKLDLMPGDNLYELWGYHQRVQANLVRNIDEFRGSGAYATLNLMLKCRGGATHVKSRTWIDSFIFSMTSNPSLFDLTEFQSALAHHVCHVAPVKLGCSSCAYLPIQAIDKSWTALTTFVHANMENVSLNHDDFVAQTHTNSYRLNRHSQSRGELCFHKMATVPLQLLYSCRRSAMLISCFNHPTLPTSASTNRYLSHRPSSLRICFLSPNLPMMRLLMGCPWYTYQRMRKQYELSSPCCNLSPRRYPPHTRGFWLYLAPPRNTTCPGSCVPSAPNSSWKSCQRQHQPRPSVRTPSPSATGSSVKQHLRLVSPSTTR